MEATRAETNKEIEKLRTELEEAVKASRGMLIFQDTRPHLDLVVYDYIIRRSRILRMVVDCLNGTVLERNGYGVLQLLSTRLSNGVSIEMIVRDEHRCNPATMAQIRELMASHKQGLKVYMASKDLQMATETKNDAGEVVGYFTFTVGDGQMYRQEHYKSDSSTTPYEAYNGINDPGHAKELEDLFIAYVRGCLAL